MAERLKNSRRRYLFAVAVAALTVAAIAAAVARAGTSDTSSLEAEKQARANVDSPSVDPSSYASAKASYIESHPTPEGSSISLGPSDSYLVTGIIDMKEGPFPADAYAMENGWQEVENGTLVQVWAGAYYSDSEHGVVLVRTLANWPNPTADDETRTTYDAPDGAGSLRVAAVDGNLLVLSAASGASYEFDPNDGSFTLQSDTPQVSPSGSGAG